MVAQELADCISLPDGTIAQLIVARSLAKADSVSIEPYSDCEILESRADLVEETILKQIKKILIFRQVIKILIFRTARLIPLIHLQKKMLAL